MRIIKTYDNDNDEYEVHIIICADRTGTIELKTKDSTYSYFGGVTVHEDVLKDDYKFEDENNFGVIVVKMHNGKNYCLNPRIVSYLEEDDVAINMLFRRTRNLSIAI